LDCRHRAAERNIEFEALQHSAEELQASREQAAQLAEALAQAQADAGAQAAALAELQQLHATATAGLQGELQKCQVEVAALQAEKASMASLKEATSARLAAVRERLGLSEAEARQFLQVSGRAGGGRGGAQFPAGARV
jgi:hypothetical protein